MAFNLKDIFSRIGSKANTERPSYKAPSGAGNIKTQMEWKHGLGEFADIKKRRKPGESKFNYDVRMKRFRGKEEGKSYTSEDLIEGKIYEQSLLPEVVINPNDKRDQSKPQNFGIIPGMSFGEAFAQAGKGLPELGVLGAKENEPFFWTNPKTGEEKQFLYAFEKKEEEEEEEEDVTDIDMDKIPDYIQGTTRYHK